MNCSFGKSVRSVATIALVSILLTPLCWSATPSYKVLYEFQGPPDGYNPSASLILDASGNLYGTTQVGGTGAGGGTVFELSPTATGWTEAVLYSFQAGNDGAYPNSTLVMDPTGNLYGTTEFGGSGSSGGCVETDGCGIVYELSAPATQGGPWTESTFLALPYLRDHPKRHVAGKRAAGRSHGYVAGGGTGGNCGLDRGVGNNCEVRRSSVQ